MLRCSTPQGRPNRSATGAPLLDLETVFSSRRLCSYVQPLCCRIGWVVRGGGTSLRCSTAVGAFSAAGSPSPDVTPLEGSGVRGSHAHLTGSRDTNVVLTAAAASTPPDGGRFVVDSDCRAATGAALDTPGAVRPSSQAAVLLGCGAPARPCTHRLPLRGQPSSSSFSSLTDRSQDPNLCWLFVKTSRNLSYPFSSPLIWQQQLLSDRHLYHKCKFRATTTDKRFAPMR